jgi:hypothetical protein
MSPEKALIGTHELMKTAESFLGEDGKSNPEDYP